MLREIVLVIILGWEELKQRDNLRDDGCGETARVRESFNIASSVLLLRGIGVENGGTILRANIRPLSIKLGRVVRHFEEHLQQLLVRHFR